MMDSAQPDMFSTLVNKTVVAIERLALAGFSDHPDPLEDKGSVLFTLDDGRRFEFLDAQDSDMGVLLFKEILTDADLVTRYDLAREGGEFAVITPLNATHAQLPWRVTNVTEVWSPDPEKPYWRGATLWHFPGKPLRHAPPHADLGHGRALLSMFLRPLEEDVWIGPVSKWWEYLHFDHAFVGKTEYLFYGGPSLWWAAER